MKEKNVLLQIFLIGTVYFIASTCYSVIFYQEKFLIDASYFIFEISNNEWFPSTHQREIMFLQQIIPVMFAKMGLSIKHIMIAYVINVYLLYYILFAIIVWLLKDPAAALLYLFVHIGGSPYSYFLIAAELLPGCTVLVLLLSLIRNLPNIKNKYLAYASSIFLLLVVIRSHPLVIVCFAALFCLLFINKPKLFLERKKFFFAFLFLGLCAVVQKLLFMNLYDEGYIIRSLMSIYYRIIQPYFFDLNYLFLILSCSLFIIFLFFKRNSKRIRYYLMLPIGFILIIIFWKYKSLSIENIINIIDSPDLKRRLNYIVYIFYGRWFFTLSVLSSIVVLFVKRKYFLLFFFIFSIAFYSVLLLGVLNLESVRVHKLYVLLSGNWETMAHDTWGMPLRVIPFSVFFFLLFSEEQLLKNIKTIYVVFIIYVGFNFYIIHDIRIIATDYLTQTKMIIDSCINQDVSKALFPISALDEEIPVLDHVYVDILVFSSLNYDKSIQVIYAPKDSFSNYNEVSENKIILQQFGAPININNLNDNYYDLNEEPYSEIKIE